MTDLEIQTKLKALGFYFGELDGIVGPKTREAISSFKQSIGFRARPYVGPLTRRALRKAKALPWMAEINKVYGLHEIEDNGELSRWLKSDSCTVGDPARIAWCGDAVETAVKRALPEETIIKNPYWARNWAKWGRPCGYVYGAVASFKRGSGGHVGFLVGINKKKTLLRIRGGNQSNEVNDTWIRANRLMPKGLRWPKTWSVDDQEPIPMVSSSGAFISVNEA